MFQECCEDISNLTAFCRLQLSQKKDRYSKAHWGNL